MSTSDNSPHSPSSTFDSGTPSLTFSSTESSVSVSSAEPGPNFVFSALEYESESKFLHFVIQELEIWHQKNLSSPEPGHTVYQFTHLPISLGELLFTEIDKRFRLRQTWNTNSRTLRVKMPGEGHDCVQRWLTKSCSRWVRSGLIDWNEYDNLDAGVGTDIKLPTSPFAKSCKQPDFFLRPKDDELLPTIAVEVGWSQSAPALREDMELLLRGGGGAVDVVILVNWKIRQQGTVVAGTVEAWRLDQNGQPTMTQSEEIFPIPNPAQTQRLGVTRRELFESILRPGRNPNEILYFDIDLLRSEASYTFRLINLSPA
ncbi:hypothetical protein PEBR_43229 [Penicillium brasilianum]|uniref:Uncharacterized protein n=1 Tax=Penicillium brasilianum TaxID=104259 RepID=A0A1S9R926_PENBI|nr:hypothetical protein PEBR_43229 [Penicillium brasilianum]